MWRLGTASISVWLLGSLAKENTAGTNFQLVQNSDLNGMTCAESRLDALFSYSPIQCSAICKSNASCLSAFYNSDDNRCILCSKVFMTHTETGLTSDVGSKYYYSTDVAIKKTGEEEAEEQEEEGDDSEKGEEDEAIQYFGDFAYFKIHASGQSDSERQCAEACDPAKCEVVRIETATENTFLKQFATDCPVYIGHTVRDDGSIAYTFRPKLAVPFASQFTTRNNTQRCIALKSTGNWTSVGCDLQLASVYKISVHSGSPAFQLTPAYWAKKQLEDYRCNF